MNINCQQHIATAQRSFAQKLNVAPEELRAEKCQEELFSSLALGLEGEIGAAIMVDGFKVGLEYQQDHYEYRATNSSPEEGLCLKLSPTPMQIHHWEENSQGIFEPKGIVG